MAKRVAALMLALLILLPCMAQADSVAMVQKCKDELAYAEEGRFVQHALKMFCQDVTRSKPAHMGSWYLHPGGFAFRIPDGLELMGKYRGASILLVDDDKANIPFRNSIAVTISDADKGLSAMTEESVQTAYRSGFDRFSMGSFSKEKLYGVPGVRLSFTSGSSPQLLMHQQMFNKDGRYYVITLTVENSFRSIAKGLEQLTEFCDSLMFVSDIDRLPK